MRFVIAGVCQRARFPGKKRGRGGKCRKRYQPPPPPLVAGHRIVSALASNREAKDLTFSHLSRQVCYLGSSKRAATHIHTLRLAPGVSNALPRIDI